MRKSLKLFANAAATVALCATLGLTGPAGTAAAETPGIPSVGHDWAGAGPYTPNVSIGLVHTLYYPRELGRTRREAPRCDLGERDRRAPRCVHLAVAPLRQPRIHRGRRQYPGEQLRRHHASGIDLVAGKASRPIERLLRQGRPGTHWCGGALTGRFRGDQCRDRPPRRHRRRDPAGPAQRCRPDRRARPLSRRRGRRNRLAGGGAGDVRGRRPRARRVCWNCAAPRTSAPRSPAAICADPSTAWLRYWLLDDPNARTEFFGASCGYCTDTQQFSDFDRNDLARQIPG